MALFVIERSAPLPEEGLHRTGDGIQVRVDQAAFLHGQDVEKAFFLVKAQGQRAVLFHVAEGKLHFVAVARGHGAAQKALIRRRGEKVRP